MRVEGFNTNVYDPRQEQRGYGGADWTARYVKPLPLDQARNALEYDRGTLPADSEIWPLIDGMLKTIDAVAAERLDDEHEAAARRSAEA